jgi:hypothetical protein
MDRLTEPSDQPTDVAQATYEPPCIERVLTPEDLEREVLYAGLQPSIDAVS